MGQQLEVAAQGIQSPDLLLFLLGAAVMAGGVLLPLAYMMILKNKREFRKTS